MIDEHYTNQAANLGEDEASLKEQIQKFRDDESQHLERAINEGAEDAPGHEILTKTIRAGSRIAIWLSSRI